MNSYFHSLVLPWCRKAKNFQSTSTTKTFFICFELHILHLRVHTTFAIAFKCKNVVYTA